MAKLNVAADWVAGTDGNIVVNDVVVRASADLARWLDVDNIIYRAKDDPLNPTLESLNVRTLVKTPSISVSVFSALIAGNARWAAATAVGGMFSNVLTAQPDGGVLDASRDGTLAIRPNVLSGVGFTLFAPDGTVTVGPDVATPEFQVLGPTAAVWNDGGAIATLNAPVPSLFYATPVSGLKMAQVGGVWWAVYTDGQFGYVATPVTDITKPIAINPLDAGSQFNLDIVASGNRIYFVYSLQPIETLASMVFGWIDTATGETGTSSTAGGPELLTSNATFNIVDAAAGEADLVITILPSLPSSTGKGRIIHPQLGAFDYEVKPDEWVNIDTDVIIPPVWASTKTLTSAANVRWTGNIRDVLCEERWKSLGGLAMPIEMLRALVLVWCNPVDPAVGYVQWYPDYTSAFGYLVLPVDLKVGGQGITLNDVANYKNELGPDGWVTEPVTFSLRIVDRIA